MINSRIYYINSLRALTGTSSHFTYQITLPQDSKFDRVALMQANIPVSYYVVQAGYNRLTFNENGDMASITIPPGNYNALTFASVVAALMNASTPNGNSYTITFPNSYVQANTGKFTITTSSANPTSLIFDFYSVYEQMGFTQGTFAFTAKTLVSPNVICMVPETNILIHSDIVDNGGDDLLETVYYNNSQPLSNATFQCTDIIAWSKTLRTNQSNTYTFSITDEHNNELNLNGRNVLFSIILFRKDNWTDVVKNGIKYLLQGN